MDRAATTLGLLLALPLITLLAAVAAEGAAAFGLTILAIVLLTLLLPLALAFVDLDVGRDRA